jgi:hypothetical protein
LDSPVHLPEVQENDQHPAFLLPALSFLSGEISLSFVPDPFFHEKPRQLFTTSQGA